MRTNIDIADDLMEEALRASGLKTKRKVVEEALKTLIRLKRQETVKKYFGKLPWSGDLKSMRRGR